MEGTSQLTFINEEIKGFKLFLWLFYIIFICYDLLYYVLFPYFNGIEPGVPYGGMGYWYYLAVFGLLPVALYLIKAGKPYLAKYLHFIGFASIDFMNNFFIYFGETKEFQSGNVAEVSFILFAPLFVNKKYFWTVTAGLIGKYILSGILFAAENVLFPIVLIIIFSGISYLLLNRFYSFIDALTKTFQELRQKEKLAAVGQMASVIGHEIRNPLSALKGFTQLQMEKHPADSDHYHIMIEEINRINMITDDLLYLSKPKSVSFQMVNFNDLILYVVSILKQQAESSQISFGTALGENMPDIECDEKLMKQVFINLVKNAIEAMPEGGIVHITSELLETGKASVKVIDQGSGIKAEELDKISIPFYTTKADGTGLGLMVTNRVITEHGGEITFESEEGKGTSVNITLPVYQESRY